MSEPINEMRVKLRELFADDQGVVRCAMCLRPEHEVRVMVACGLVMLCNRCVRAAQQALDQYDREHGLNIVRTIHEIAEAEIVEGTTVVDGEG